MRIAARGGLCLAAVLFMTTLARGGEQPVLTPVQITTGVNFFKPGDSITITEVTSTSPELKPGDTVAVKGTYTLATESNAMLALSVTTTGKETHRNPTPGQRMQVSEAEGKFTLTTSIVDKGYLHVSFYTVTGDKSLGGIYFGTADQMREIQDWDLKKQHETE